MVGVKNMDEAVWREIRAEAVRRGVQTGTLIGAMYLSWMWHGHAENEGLRLEWLEKMTKEAEGDE